MDAERRIEELKNGIRMQFRRIRWLCRQIVQLASELEVLGDYCCPPSCLQEYRCQKQCENCWRLASLNAAREDADGR